MSHLPTSAAQLPWLGPTATRLDAGAFHDFPELADLRFER